MPAKPSIVAGGSDEQRGTALPSEDVLEVVVRRHVFSSGRPFPGVLEGIFGGISQPDTELLFGELAASTSYEQFGSLVLQAQGSAGLMRFRELDLDHALTLDPPGPPPGPSEVLATAPDTPDLPNGASACP